MKWNEDEMSWLAPAARELLRFACTHMVHSYKPVLMDILLSELPDTEFPFETVARRFVEFYRDRERRGLPVERRGCAFMSASGLDEQRCALTAGKILSCVFASEPQRVQMSGGRVRLVAAAGWRHLEDEDVRTAARHVLTRSLADFYERIELMGEAIYGRPQGDHAASAHEVVFLLPDSDDGEDLPLLRARD